MGFKYDFAGWASKNNIKCADGRTIRQDAFKECDGKTVPLVFMHNHKDVDNVLGHCLLENRPEGFDAHYLGCDFYDDSREGCHEHQRKIA